MKSSQEYMQIDCKRTELCGTFTLKGQDDKAGQPRMTEKEQLGRYLQEKWFTVSNNVDKWNDAEAICGLEKSNFNGTMGIKSRFIQVQDKMKTDANDMTKTATPLWSFIV